MIEERWTFSGRVFGGYSAALLVREAAKDSPLPELLSANVTFLRALLPTDYEVDVEEIRSGRTAKVAPSRSMKFVSPMKSATKRVAGAS